LISLRTPKHFFAVTANGPLERKLQSSPTFRARQRTASGLGMISLGAYVALSDDDSANILLELNYC
jgi:hypothetical protein